MVAVIQVTKIHFCALGCRVQYVTSVKLGSATAGSVSAHTPVPALSLTPSVWSANEASGTTVSECAQQ